MAFYRKAFDFHWKAQGPVLSLQMREKLSRTKSQGGSLMKEQREKKKIKPQKSFRQKRLQQHHLWGNELTLTTGHLQTVSTFCSAFLPHQLSSFLPHFWVNYGLVDDDSTSKAEFLSTHGFSGLPASYLLAWPGMKPSHEYNSAGESVKVSLGIFILWYSSSTGRPGATHPHSLIAQTLDIIKCAQNEPSEILRASLLWAEGKRVFGERKLLQSSL